MSHDHNEHSFKNMDDTVGHEITMMMMVMMSSSRQVKRCPDRVRHASSRGTGVRGDWGRD